MIFEGSPMFGEDSSKSRSDTCIIITGPNKKGISTHEESEDQNAKKLGIYLYAELMSKTLTKLKDKSLFKEKKSKRGGKVPSKDN